MWENRARRADGRRRTTGRSTRWTRARPSGGGVRACLRRTARPRPWGRSRRPPRGRPGRRSLRTPREPSVRREARAARAEVPRSSQAVIEFDEHRDPVALLEEQAASRVPELVPIRYGRMLASPFAFYRGGALIMAADLARTPDSGSARAAVRRRAPVELRGVRLARAEPRLRHQRLRRDGCPGPWEWDVKRLAASFAIGGRENGFSDEGAARGRARHRSRLPRGDGRVRADAQPRASGTRSLSVEQAVRGVHAPASTRSG